MRSLLKLAVPVTVAYLGFMTMGVVDLLFVGRVSAAAMGALGVGTSIFSGFLVFGIGLLSGMDYHAGHAFGGGRPEDCDRVLGQGLWLSIGISLPVVLLMILIAHQLDGFGLNAEVIPAARAYLTVLSYSLPPALLFAAFRNYLQVMGGAHATMWVLLLANLINALLNWILVFGKFGFPALGAVGSAWATLAARLSMAGVAALLVLRYKRPGRDWIVLDMIWMKKIWQLGLPAAGQMALEVGVFATATILAGSLSPNQIAAHQIVLNVASLMFMVPLGIGAAAAVRLSQALGRGDPRDAARTGGLAILLGGGFMLLSCILLLTAPAQILGIYTTVPAVIEVGRTILVVAAIFQLSDGLQTVLTGALRGLADTRSTFIANLVGHWFVGLPLGAYLCFSAGRGLQGLWIGLATGLSFVAVSLLWRWKVLSRRISAAATLSNALP